MTVFFFWMSVLFYMSQRVNVKYDHKDLSKYLNEPVLNLRLQAIYSGEKLSTLLTGKAKVFD